jgi:hypothetical protein
VTVTLTGEPVALALVYPLKGVVGSTPKKDVAPPTN